MTTDKQTVDLVSECFLNVLRGSVRVKIRGISRHETLFRKVTTRLTSLETRRALLLTKFGFHLTKIIIQACFVHLNTE